jgi:hypothetical protein
MKFVQSSEIPVKVSEASGSRVAVAVYDMNLLPSLEKLGFEIQRDSDNITASLESQSAEHKAQIFTALIDLGACFSFGPGWSPSEVVLYLRDLGLIKRKFKRVSWSGAGKPPIVDEL